MILAYFPHVSRGFVSLFLTLIFLSPFFSISCAIFGSGFVMTFLFSLSFINYIGLVRLFFLVLFHCLISYNSSLPPTYLLNFHTFSILLIYFVVLFFSFRNSIGLAFLSRNYKSFPSHISYSHLILHASLAYSLRFCFDSCLCLRICVFVCIVFAICDLCFILYVYKHVCKCDVPTLRMVLLC